jgi:hypothetical protein
MNKKEVLTTAKAQREQEVFEYQINIDNYRNALALLEAMPAEEREPMKEFEAQLRGLLQSSLFEQAKAKLMLNAISAQLQ